MLGATALLVLSPVPAEGALVVNSNLGSFGVGSSVNVSGDTANGANNADVYFPLTSGIGNWGNELVYEFTLTERATIGISSNTQVGDPDFFLLDGLSTSSSGGKQNPNNALASAFLDAGPPATKALGGYEAGTYFLSVDSFIGFDGSVTPADATFDINLTFGAIPAPPPGFFDLGIIGDESTPVTLDTFGSNFDTQLGLFDSLGNLLLTNDDAGGGFQSEIGPELLTNGEYFVGLGGFNTLFENGFSVSPGSETGDFDLNYAAGVSGTESGAINSSNQLAWYRFELGSSTAVPDGGSTVLLSLLAFGSLGAARRWLR